MMYMEKRSVSRRLLATVGFVAVLLIGWGTWFYVAERRHAYQSVTDELIAIGQLKANEIAGWRRKQLSEARELMARPLLTARLRAFLANPNDTNPEELLTEFRVAQEHGEYTDVILVNKEGRFLLCTSGIADVAHREIIPALTEALREGNPAIVDLHTCDVDAKPHISVIAPLLSTESPSSGAYGAIVLVTEADRFLYPLIQSWPTPRDSAETLLVRREGDEVVFLNELRHRPDTALRLRIPLSRTEVPAVMAVLGREGLFQGHDYRGIEVVAYLVSIPDSPWFMVAKEDTSEVFARWHSRSILILATFSLVMGLFLAVGFAFWLRTQRQHYADLYRSEAALRESEERFRVYFEESLAGMAITSPEKGWLKVNKALCEMLGYSPEELSQTSWADLTHPDDLAADEMNFERLLKGEIDGYHIEKRFVCKDGHSIPVMLSVKAVRKPDGRLDYVLAQFQDLTARKHSEESLRETRDFLENLLDYANAPIIVWDPSFHITRFNHAFERLSGRTADDVIGRELGMQTPVEKCSTLCGGREVKHPW